MYRSLPCVCLLTGVKVPPRAFPASRFDQGGLRGRGREVEEEERGSSVCGVLCLCVEMRS